MNSMIYIHWVFIFITQMNKQINKSANSRTEASWQCRQTNLKPEFRTDKNEKKKIIHRKNTENEKTKRSYMEIKQLI